MFSVANLQEDMEREELLKKLQLEEEERLLAIERQNILKRNRMLAEKKHQIKRKLQQRRTQQQQQHHQDQNGSEAVNKGGKHLPADHSINDNSSSCEYILILTRCFLLLYFQERLRE